MGGWKQHCFTFTLCKEEIMKFICSAICCLLLLQSRAQTNQDPKQQLLDRFGFEEQYVLTKEDTIFFYTHKRGASKPKHLVLYLQGTAPDPLFSIEEENGRMATYRWFPGDYKLLDSNYCYAVIAKTGIASILRPNTEKNIAKYQKLNSLYNRVSRADTVINHMAAKLFPNLEDVIVYGHSEGAPVAAKLATVNNKITHLGFWAGNALPDFYDFMLFNTKAVDQGEISRKEAFEDIEKTLSSFQEIADKPEETAYEGEQSYTNKRWWSYAEPPINNLLQVDIPIFMQVAGRDESAPIESTFLVPLEFTRLRKSNLTYRICADCDHGFNVEQADGEVEDKWTTIFGEFMHWTKTN
jgi:hypothetical protein